MIASNPLSDFVENPFYLSGHDVAAGHSGRRRPFLIEEGTVGFEKGFK